MCLNGIIMETKISPTLTSTPAFGYLRLSGAGQTEGDGFPRQREAIQNFASTNGYVIIRWFEEKAMSGRTEWDERPAWMEMIGALNGTRTILVEKLDRLARDLMVQEHIIADLRRRKVGLVSVASGEELLCVDDPGRKLMRQIMGAIHEYDRAMLTAKLDAARRRIRERDGKCEGRKAFGVKEGEAEVLEVMQVMRKRGDTFKQIAAGLNQARAEAGGVGYGTRTGGKWIGAAVCKILRREGV